MQGAGLVLTSYQDGLTRAMDVVANNIANTTTTGFKRQEIAFDSLISRPVSNEEFIFAVDRGSYRDTSPGAMVMTGNELDLAIQGTGYFPIQTKGGTRYTRAGSFQVNQEGEIVTAAGEKLLGDGDQPIAIPEGAINLSISGDGMINVTLNGTRTEVGRIKLVSFKSEQDMKFTGNNQYSTSQTPEADSKSTVRQGMVEQSNVQSVTEITNMINVMRSYQMSMHLLELDNQRLSSAITRLSKTTI